VGSPEPDATFKLDAIHEGVTKTVSMDIPGQRLNPPFDWMTLVPFVAFIAVAAAAVAILAKRSEKR
jgi:hypothetical protein